MKLTRNHYPVRYNREIFYSADNDSYLYTTKGGSHLKKVSENETRMYNLCTLSGKELDTGHSSTLNSELSYYT
jgi:hypothetical protein